MKSPYEAVRVSEHVYWVGAIDWGIRDFHGYRTSRGSTYNAYLIEADDYILIDTVRAPFAEELISRVSSVTDPGNIRYIISNHSEMDHSGSLPRVIEQVKPEKVFASPMGVKALKAHFGPEMDVTVVKDGESMNLGGVSLSFLETRMLHWPDSMITYVAEDRLLFSQDGFGMHLASGRRFADEIPISVRDEENARYYANILLPYSPVVLKLLERVAASGLDIRVIAPDHGPILRTPADIEHALGEYARWAAQAPTLKAVVVFDTMWGSTERMGRAAAEALIDEGVDVKVMALKSNHRSDVATELLDAGALLVGTATLNNGMLPAVADVLTYVKGLKPRNLVGGAFGSFGWSGEGAKHVNEVLEQMAVELVREPLSVKYVPDGIALDACRSLGAGVAARLKEVMVGGS